MYFSSVIDQLLNPHPWKTLRSEYFFFIAFEGINQYVIIAPVGGPKCSDLHLTFVTDRSLSIQNVSDTLKARPLEGFMGRKASYEATTLALPYDIPCLYRSFNAIPTS